MKIVEIQSVNYRTLENVQIKFTSEYCTISGKNNAGKSSVISLLRNLFKDTYPRPWALRSEFDYKEDFTQWKNKESEPISITYVIELLKNDDPALISFIEKFTNNTIPNDVTILKIFYLIEGVDSYEIKISINDDFLDDKTCKEVIKRIKDSNLLFLYNSTAQAEDYFYPTGRRRMFYDFVMSEEERKAIDEANKTVERKLRNLAKAHKEGLTSILGKLSERYDVEFSAPEGYASRHMPLGINLRDKTVEVPLNEWGSGTQNRTHILMSILQASRIKTADDIDERITPFVVIEEPECFLHPAAQAEFGRILRSLASELGIQIIATTHSPYMLNQEVPKSNILLDRLIKRNKALGTFVVDTNNQNWMAPFAQHLGINQEEFINWKPVFSTYKSKALLVEGSIDAHYFEYFRSSNILNTQIPQDIEIIPYDGKDTLKNTTLLGFVLKKFDTVYITFDLDAKGDVEPCLKRLNLSETIHYLPIGTNKPGRDCIEGLLPDSVLNKVNSKYTDLIMGLSSSNTKDKKSAKDQLKKLYLDEFKKTSQFTATEISQLQKVVNTITTNMK